MAQSWRTLSLIVCLLCGYAHSIVAKEGTCQKETNDGDQTCKSNPEETGEIKTKTKSDEYKSYKFPGCRLYLAQSTVQDPQGQTEESSRLGLFTSEPLSRGQRIAPSDIIIHLTDYLPGLGSLLYSHSYNPQPFGGQYEARSVASILPGVASIAVPTFHKDANAVPFGRDVDEANVPRTKMAGAGAFTHYHNLTFYAKHNLEAGSEIFVGLNEKDGENYKWYKDRVQSILDLRKSDIDKESKSPNRLDVHWLIDNGVCVDNLIPDKSTIKGAGRGAFATRFIPKGTIVSATPLIPIDRNATMTKRIKHLGKIQNSVPQLLINYCLGRVNSSALFYPTSPVVNLINHANDDSGGNNGDRNKHKPNVRMRWSKATKARLAISSESVPINADTDTIINSDNFIMEYVATKDIKPKEEILLDYGTQWQNAWNHHQTNWNPPPDAHYYSPSYVMDDVAALLRNEKEQMSHPYPANVMTACFYKYSTHEKNDGIASASTGGGGSTVIKWKMDRQTFDYSNLRPCSIMHRDDAKGDGYVTYTAMMKNYAGMKKVEMIPKGEIHVVDSIPRNAVRFVDKMYSTDVHLKNSFRHEIQIPDELFPSSWIDLI